jgi:hypothetical protein
MRVFKLLISAALSVCMTVGAARADTISFFDVSGLGTNNYSFTGGLSMDVTTGTLLNGDFFFSNQGVPRNGDIALVGGSAGTRRGQPLLFFPDLCVAL